MAEDEEIAYDFSTELHSNHSVSDATYARALAKFGEQGIVDMVGLTALHDDLDGAEHGAYGASSGRDFGPRAASSVK